MGNIPFADLQYDSITIERCQLEENIASLDGRTQALAPIAFHHDGIEGRYQLGAREPGDSEIDFSASLRELRIKHRRTTSIVLRESITVLTFELHRFPDPIAMLDLQVAIVQTHKQRTFLYQVARARMRLSDIAFDARCHRAHHPTLQLRTRSDPEITWSERKECQHENERRDEVATRRSFSKRPQNGAPPSGQ
jgi:hypothetical protein